MLWGAMLYQLLTGQVPRGVFRPASQLIENLDPRYDAIVTKALQVDPDERYQDAAEFRNDLDQVVVDPGSLVAMKKTRFVTAKAPTAGAAAEAGAAVGAVAVKAASGGGVMKWAVGAVLVLAVAAGGLLMLKKEPKAEGGGKSSEGGTSEVAEQGASKSAETPLGKRRLPKPLVTRPLSRSPARVPTKIRWECVFCR